jgi:hypothetical protein
MPFDKLKYPKELWEDRRKGVEASLQAISVDELKKIVKQHEEEFLFDPSRDEFLHLITEQPQARFYCAMPEEDIVVYYCQDADFGVWVVPGCGIGPLDATSKRLMKEIIESSFSGRKIGENK